MIGGESVEQTLTLTEREMNLVRYSLNQEHDRLAKELLTETERSILIDEKEFPDEAFSLACHRESLVRRIHQISELLKKI